MARTGVKVAILASGEGTNAERLIRTAEAREDVDIALVGCNRAEAGVLRRAEALGAVHGVVHAAGERKRAQVQNHSMLEIVCALCLTHVPPLLQHTVPFPFSQC